MEKSPDTTENGNPEETVTNAGEASENGPTKPEEVVPKQNVSDDSQNTALTDGQTSDSKQSASESTIVDHPLANGEPNNVQDESPKKGRRVYFPMDERVVSGYMDPPNPWQDAEKCSTEDLVNAYKQACDKQNIKPIPKLYNQLQAISDFNSRNETLTLKGEKLDSRHVETLEEVLRRVQFRTLDIENTHIEDEGAVALFDMIEYYESCTKLNISFNKNVGLRGWQACARMLKKSPCVECIDCRSCALSEQVMPMLGRALRMGSQLTTLHLENAILSGRPLMILVTAIKMNEILRELYLADNKLMPSDGIQLGNMLKFNHKLQLLDIRNNHLQDVGTSHLCDGLYEQNLGSGLNTLVLWNNQITYQSMHSLGRALASTQSLETLNLGHNNITNEGIHRMKEGLILNKSLLRMGLQAAKISCEGAVALAEFIADSRSLVRIDLRENDIKTGGLMALSLALKVTETVTRIDLDKDPKKESGVKDYMEQQRRLLLDINNLTIRNRDLMRKREEEEAAKLKEEEEAKQKAEDEEKERLEKEGEEVAEKEKEQSEEEQEEAKEDIGEMSENNKLTERLKLKLPLSSPTQTLESPAFVRETDMPITVPPTEQELASQAAAQAAAAASQQVPIEFPPSPMAPQPEAKVLLGSTIESPESPDKAASPIPKTDSSPSHSPNSRRKFVISRVEEKGGAKWGAHAAAAAAAAGAESGDKAGEAANSSGENPEVNVDKSEASNGLHGIPFLELEVAEECQEDGGTVSDCVSNVVNNAVEQHSETTDSQRPPNDAAEAAQSETQENDSHAENSGPQNFDNSGEFTPSIESLESNTKVKNEPLSTDNIKVELSESSEEKEDSHVETTKAPDFHSNLSMNGMKTELATVLDSLDTSKKKKVPTATLR